MKENGDGHVVMAIQVYGWAWDIFNSKNKLRNNGIN